MILTVANQKGGVGKTTASVFLAHALAEAAGAACTLVDADPQASAAEWARRAAEVGRPLEVPVVARPTPRLAALLPDSPNVVVDTPPADAAIVAAAIEIADLVLVPTSASTLDLSRVQVTVDAATRRGKPVVVLLTRTRRTRSVGSAEASLRSAGVHVLRTHIPLREALALAFGQPVRQLHGYDLALAEVLGALPEQPYSFDAVRQRAARSPAGNRTPLPSLPSFGHRAGLGDPAAAAQAPRRFGPIGLDDDEIVQRLKTSMARLAAQK